jgi:lipoate-protein ligase B
MGQLVPCGIRKITMTSFTTTRFLYMAHRVKIPFLQYINKTIMEEKWNVKRREV